METRVVGEFPIVAQGDVFLLPVFVEGFVGPLVEVSLFDRNGSAATQLAAITVFSFLFFALLALFVFLLRRRWREKVRSPARLPAAAKETKQNL